MSDDDTKQLFWTALADSPNLMVGLHDRHEHSLPMRAQLDEDAHGAFWFFTRLDNRLAEGGRAMAQFAARDHSLFACIDGTLSRETDGTMLDRLWSNAVAVWYPDGKQQSGLLLLRFDLNDAEVWTADVGVTGLFKMATGLTIKPREVGDHATLNLTSG